MIFLKHYCRIIRILCVGFLLSSVAKTIFLSSWQSRNVFSCRYSWLRFCHAGLMSLRVPSLALIHPTVPASLVLYAFLRRQGISIDFWLATPLSIAIAPPSWISHPCLLVNPRHFVYIFSLSWTSSSVSSGLAAFVWSPRL